VRLGGEAFSNTIPGKKILIFYMGKKRRGEKGKFKNSNLLTSH